MAPGSGLPDAVRSGGPRAIIEHLAADGAEVWITGEQISEEVRTAIDQLVDAGTHTGRHWGFGHWSVQRAGEAR